MKNLLLFLILMTFSTAVFAQTVPEGIRYQAIARDLSGKLLADQSITVQIELLTAEGKESVYYTEHHTVKSNPIGLIDFVIGQGLSIKGSFSDVPWPSHEMWIRMSVRLSGEKDYQIISTGQLFSVPFAQYAEQAGTLTTNGRGPTAPFTNSTSINWITDGNFNAKKRNGEPAVLGTTDLKALTIVTSDTPRMIIENSGQINIMLSVGIGDNLNVNGSTTLNGSLLVSNMSPTYLTGTLTVDKATTIHETLTVTNANPSHLTGALDVDKTLNADGAVTLNNSLTVTSQASSNLSGTLTTDGVARFNDAFSVKNLAPAHLTGLLDVDQALNVDGQTTLNSKLDVTGSATRLSGTLRVDQPTTLNDDLNVENNAPTKLTGSLDIDKSVTVDGAVTLQSDLQVTGGSATTFSGSLTVDQATVLQDELLVSNASPTQLTGSLDVDGAINVGGAITLDGPLVVSDMNPTTLTGTLTVDQLARMHAGMAVSGAGSVGPGSSYLAFFDNQEGGATDGIAIQIQQTDVSKLNNFMTFYKGNGSTIAGRIEGYQISDIDEIPAPTGDEIWSAVCLGLADYNPITIAWTQFASAFNVMSYGWNNITIPSFDIPDIPPFTIPNVPALTIPDVPAFVIPDVPGFTIPDVPGVVIPDIPALDFGPWLCTTIQVCPCPCLDFSFTCCCVDEEVCLIPEFEVFPSITLPDFPGIPIPDFPGIPIVDFPGFAVTDFPGIAIPDFPGLEIPAVPELNMKDLFGEAPTIPTFNDILVDLGVCPDEDLFDLNDGYFARLAVWAFEHRLTDFVTIDPLRLIANGLAWGLTTAVLNNGAVYGSKGADYAEYLPKKYPYEQFLKGEVVGVYNGKISKNTVGADQVLAITSQPLVLGNMQEDGDMSNFEKVAFLGQIPVFVQGPVRIGDYILPSGMNDGVAIALPQEAITTEMLSSIIGTAWTGYDQNGITLINTSIGLRPNEITHVLRKQQVVESSLQERLNLQREGSEVMTSDITTMKESLGLTRYNP